MTSQGDIITFYKEIWRR